MVRAQKLKKKPFEKGRDEQMDERQLEMLQGADGCQVMKSEKPSDRRTPRRIRLPEDIKRIETTIEPDEVLADPGKWKRIGEERTERVYIISAQFVVEVIIRGKYVHIEDREHPPVIAPFPSTLVDRTLCGVCGDGAVRFGDPMAIPIAIFALYFISHGAHGAECSTLLRQGGLQELRVYARCDVFSCLKAQLWVAPEGPLRSYCLCHFR